MKPKILIVDAFQGLGGEEEISYFVYNNIDRHQFDVYLAGPEHASYFNKNIPKDNEWIKVKTKSKTDIISMYKFREMIRAYKIDIINVHGYSAGYFVRMACVGMRHVKIIWTMHLNIEDVTSMNKIKKVISTKIENILNSSKFFTDAIVCVSQDSVLQLRKRGVSKIPLCVIYNGVNIGKFRKVINRDIRSEELILGFVSRLSVQKGIPVLLDAFKVCCEKQLKIKLIIAGEGELKDYIQDYINSNNMKEIINIIGFQNDVRKVFELIDIVVLPSYYECFPVINLEAGCSGIPVIASSVNGVPEQIVDGYNGRLFESGDSKSLAKLIEYYYYNREKVKEHGENARDRVIREFDEKYMVKEYQNLYLELMNRGRK